MLCNHSSHTKHLHQLHPHPFHNRRSLNSSRSTHRAIHLNILPAIRLKSLLATLHSHQQDTLLLNHNSMLRHMRRLHQCSSQHTNRHYSNKHRLLLQRQTRQHCISKCLA